MTRPPQTLIVPGLDGSPDPHWQDWWARTDPDALMVDISSPSRPVLATWQAMVATQVFRHPGCILVGHSLGAVTIAHLLTRWPDLPVRAALLVAPADPSVSARTRAFGVLPKGRFSQPATVVASRNDPWMIFDQARALASDWNSEFCDLGYAGHINIASGYGPWPQGKALRNELMTRSGRVFAAVSARIARPARFQKGVQHV